nr:MAG TPA: hypothetical protein [Bacteriophage sp.]
MSIRISAKGCHGILLSSPLSELEVFCKKYNKHTSYFLKEIIFPQHKFNHFF